jgi:tetratricopeptide (TPR) repeat protein
MGGIAGALAALGKLQDALPLAERSVELNPTYGPARLTLGVVLLRLGRSDEAIAQLGQTERLGPDSSQNMLCLAKSGSWDRACDALRLACDTDPEVSLASVESLIRDCYTGSKDVEEYVALARKLWAETSGGPGSP